MSMLFNSCRKENAFDCFKGNGKEITVERNPGEFSFIEIFDKVEVTIIKGTSYKVEITAGNKIMKNIVTEVIGNILRIENRNTCNFVRGYKHQVKITITLPYLEKITNNSVGTVYFDENFEQDTLVVRAESSGDFYVKGKFNELRSSSHGNGDVYITGNCNTFYCYANGTNFLFADDLQIKDYAFIETLSYGDSHINTTGLKNFEINIHRDGNIYYRGQPTMFHDFSAGDGKGQAIRVD